ncbi:MAG TPA: CBS domain-containing protein [Pseudolabrys sp.]|jgi:CBS-domain-containing membrane protein|nr:CBS domain-containing protein [Pseudolabrys sp.]
MKAADVMATNVITVRQDTPVAKIAEVLLANRISAVPVVNDKDVIVGIVSEGDLLHRVEAGTERHHSWWLELLTGKEILASEFVKSHARKAADVMTHKVVSVQPDTTLSDIASLLEKHRIKRVPVVINGKLVGIVSRANLVQALVSLEHARKSDASVDDLTLHSNIIEQLRSKSWADPSTISVVVNNGAVELWGIVDSETEKNAIRVAVEVTPGVRQVSNKLVIEHRLNSQ